MKLNIYFDINGFVIILIHNKTKQLQSIKIRFCSEENVIYLFIFFIYRERLTVRELIKITMILTKKLLNSKKIVRIFNSISSTSEVPGTGSFTVF